MTAEVLWFSLGVALLILELVTGGFWIGFFGVGAILASTALWFGLVESLNAQVATFLIASVVCLLGLRRQLKKWRYGEGPVLASLDSVGDLAIVVEEIPAQGPGRVAYQGSTWDAESQTDEAFPVNTTVRIQRQDGTRLFVSGVEKPIIRL